MGSAAGLGEGDRELAALPQRTKAIIDGVPAPGVPTSASNAIDDGDPAVCSSMPTVHARARHGPDVVGRRDVEGGL